MNTLPFFRYLLFSGMVFATPALAKPPVPPARKSTPTPPPAAPAGASIADGPLVHWLLQQNGGKDAIAVPLADLVLAVSGRNVLSVDAGNPADAAVVAKLGGVMDRVLPGMNKPESPAHVVGRLDEVTAFFEDAIRSFAATVPGLSCPGVPGEEALMTHVAGAFPAFQVLDAASGKTYYLGVTLYPTGGREAAVRALRFDPMDAAPHLPVDGACLLVAIEHNGKTGKDIAFLNWELIDAAKLQTRVAVTFEATQSDVHLPGTVLNDGRKGRD